jgi:hypothetical protein
MAASSEEPVSDTFHKDVSIKFDMDTDAASISPSGRDVVLAGRKGLLIIDIDLPYSPPRFIQYESTWIVADTQWSPFACMPGRIAVTANQKAILFNLDMATPRGKPPIEFTLQAHDRAVTDINFSAHNPNLIATCAVDGFAYTWDIRQRVTSYTNAFGWRGELARPLSVVADFEAGGTQVKWNRRKEHILATSHDKYLRVWDTRMGSMPLTTVEAHETKIYGIDWHRSDPHNILTCSLDATIKQWTNVGMDGAMDVRKPDEASRVINNQHPVLRARHTPFRNGLLAMPQRGSSGLKLYTQTGDTNPVHTFQAHEEGARVQEFLWRSRGSFDDGIDQREFQLITLGSDKSLHLYTVTPHLLEKSVGFRKGEKITEPPTTTRKGAKYMSYRDTSAHVLAQQSEAQNPTSSQTGYLTSLFQSRVPRPGSVVHVSQRQLRETMTPGSVRHQALHRTEDTMTWMRGVQVGAKNASNVDSIIPTAKRNPVMVPEDLAAEVTQVGNIYPKAFQQVEVQDRYVVLWFRGPWGDVDTSADRKGERKLEYLRLTVRFPRDYPHVTLEEGEEGSIRVTHPVEIEFHKTMAKIDDETLGDIRRNMELIAHHRAAAGREALEALIRYGLGERSIEDSLTLPEYDTQQDLELRVGPALLAEESSSSDDEDELGIDQAEVLKSSLTSANIPLPIQTSSRFAVTGQLSLVRPPSKDLTRPAFSSAVRLSKLPAQALSRNEIFESFGRLNIPHGYDSESPTSSTASWEWASSPSSSSHSDQDIGVPPSRFQPPMAWQTPAFRFTSKTSHPSSLGATRISKEKSVVTILASCAEELIPSKRSLAEEYWIFGDGPQVCTHNASVARRSGYEDLADIWELCALILNNQVPLDVLPQPYRREQVLVLARRALVRIKRKDSGLDLQFDEADSVTNPKLKGRIKWGRHSIVSWLIPALFDHFERLADIQMLAMLACIFSEPAAREGVTSAMAKTTQSRLPMSMEAPAFSLDYFPSADAAWSLFKPTLSVPSTPAHSRFATPVNEFGWHRLTKGLDTYGSHGSSNGPWGSDTVPSDPVTPYSTGNTPPTLSRAPTGRSTASATPFSTSPEQSSHVLKKASTANFASAFATLSRPFANAISSSPPVKGRSEADLSTSAPTSGVTWGTTTFYNSGDAERDVERDVTTPRAKNVKRASFGQADQLNVIDYYPDSDSDYDESLPAVDTVSEYATTATPGETEESNIRVTLKNQDQFDDEACVSVPLLDMSKEWLYRAWRDQYAEMLGSWGLIRQRAEILKFNGLTSYFPLAGSAATSKAGSLHLGLRQDGAETPQPLSRASSNLVPPSLTPQYKRSPLASPRDFSFNPEAAEFQPGSASFEGELLAPPPDIFISSEQYLRLSIPTPQAEGPTTHEGGAFDTPLGSRSPRPGRAAPALSRGISRASFASKKVEKKESEPIYSCVICWIRVSGRFFLCPSCGHVAHFGCMESSADDEGVFVSYGFEEGECVVGCGCGCGFDGEEEFEDFRGARRTPRERKGSVVDYFHRWEDAGTGAWVQGLSAHNEGFEPSEPDPPVYGEDDRRGSGATGRAGDMAASYSPKDEKKSRMKQVRRGIRRTQTTR